MVASSITFGKTAAPNLTSDSLERKFAIMLLCEAVTAAAKTVEQIVSNQGSFIINH